MTRPDGYRRSQLFVSSLDNGGSGGSEKGTVFWSNASMIDDILAGNGFSFSYGSGSNQINVTGDVLGLPGAVSSGFSPNARYLLFTSGAGSQITQTGLNNDYLISAAALTDPVPEPGTVALMGVGLVTIVAARRRTKV